MATKKISELPNITGANLADTDEFVVVDTSTNQTNAITWVELKNGLDTSTGFVSITGDTMTGDLDVQGTITADDGSSTDWNTAYGWGDHSTAGYAAASHTHTLSEITDAGTAAAAATTDFVAVTGDTMTGDLDVQGTITADGLTVDGDITSTGGDLDLNTLDLNAIAESKAVTAVGVFVYDTSKDSDGGAWRKRTQHTSWYNETLNTDTRGSRREFPAVAVIVAEASKVTIYDGDDPALPMWLVADTIGAQTSEPYGITALGGSSNTIGPVYALNGQLCICGTNGLNTQAVLRWDFLADRFGNQSANPNYNGWTVGTISQRNSIQPFSQSLPRTLSAQTFDVAMTVLPDAPIDPATGLPVPTIAVATNGDGTYSTCVITEDGTVYDIASASTDAAVSVAFDGVSLSVVRADGTVYVWDDAGDITADGASPDVTYSASSTPALLGTTSEVVT